MDNINSGIENRILAMLEKSDIAPIPRWYFTLKNAGWLSFSIFSLLLSVISCTVGEYIIGDQNFSGDISFISRFVFDQQLDAMAFDNVPIFWLITLSIFILVSIFGFRSLKRGYRYDKISQAISVIVFCAISGTYLDGLSVGKTIHRYCMANVNGYDKIVSSDEEKWVRPDKGWIAGKAVIVDLKDGSVKLKGFKGRLWNVDITHAEIEQGMKISEEKCYKIVGTRYDDNGFVAFAIKPWMKKHSKYTRGHN